MDMSPDRTRTWVFAPAIAITLTVVTALVAIVALVVALSDSQRQADRIAQSVRDNNARLCAVIGNLGQLPPAVPPRDPRDPSSVALSRAVEQLGESARNLSGDPNFHCPRN